MQPTSLRLRTTHPTNCASLRTKRHWSHRALRHYELYITTLLQTTRHRTLRHRTVRHCIITSGNYASVRHRTMRHYVMENYASLRHYVTELCVTTSLRTIRHYKNRVLGCPPRYKGHLWGRVVGVTELYPVNAFDVNGSTDYMIGFIGGVREVWIMLHTSPGPLHPCSKQF